MGVATHALFGCTVWHLFWFLKGATLTDGGPAGLSTLLVDAVLAAVFAVPHSLLLLPAVRRRVVAAGLPGPLYGCFFCIASCLTLLATILLWQPIDVVVWRWPTPLDACVAWAFAGSWMVLLWSLHLTGLGWQTGLTPWWHWVRGARQPRRKFMERGAYRVLRHPVYLSFLGLIWFTPIVSLDRVVLMTVWTAYIVVGSVLKDRRLLHFIGDEYRGYQARVPGYPGVPFGPLARIR